MKIEKKVDVGDIINAILIVIGIIIAAAIGINQLEKSVERQTREIKKIFIEKTHTSKQMPQNRIAVGELHWFDDDHSNFKIIDINHERKEVQIFLNIRGSQSEEWLAVGQQRSFTIPETKIKYSLTNIEVPKQGEWASIIIHKHIK